MMRNKIAIIILLFLFVFCYNKKHDRTQIARVLDEYLYLDQLPPVPESIDSLIFMQNLDKKMAYAQSVYIKIPTIPTTEYEFRLKNQIERDLEGLNRDKIRSEAKATLLNSRIQFIEAQMNNNNN